MRREDLVAHLKAQGYRWWGHPAVENEELWENPMRTILVSVPYRDPLDRAVVLEVCKALQIQTPQLDA